MASSSVQYWQLLNPSKLLYTFPFLHEITWQNPHPSSSITIKISWITVLAGTGLSETCCCWDQERLSGQVNKQVAYWQTWCSWGCSLNYSVIWWVGHLLFKNLQDTVYSKALFLSPKFWQKSNNLIVTKLKKSNCDKT